MPDNKAKRGTPDRSRVSGGESYEVKYLAKKTGLPAPLDKNVIKQEGPMRTNVERYLERMKRNAR
jgi:hypothetical protein